MKNLIYIRCSTAHQEQSPETQERMMREYAEKAGLDLLDWEWRGEMHSPILVDQCSGRQKLADRKVGGILARALEPGDNLMVVRIDRLFRNSSDAAGYIDKWCEKGINLHIASFGGMTVDPRQWLGKMILKFFCWIAEFEAEMTRERILEHRAVKRKNRERTSRYPKPGFKFLKGGTKANGDPVWLEVPDDEELEVMRAMLQWSRLGSSRSEIYQTLKDRGIKRKFLEKIARRREGKVVYEWKEVEKEWSRSAINRALSIIAGMPGA